MNEVSAGWRKVAVYVAAAWAIWLVVLTIAIGGIEPFVLIFAGIPILAWAATMWKPGRVTYTIFGVLGLLVIALNLPFLIEDLAHPESAFGFTTTLWPLLTAILMILVGIAVWRPLSEALASRAFVAAVAIFVIGLVVSIIAALGLEDDQSEPGDVALFAESAEWSVDELSVADMGAVFVENKDPVRHTFTVDDLDIQVELPANTDRRVVIDALPGTYEFFCSVPGHDNMKGTLTVG